MSAMGDGSWLSDGLATSSEEEENGEEHKAAAWSCCPHPLDDFVTISGVTEIVGTGRNISDNDLKQ